MYATRIDLAVVRRPQPVPTPLWWIRWALLTSAAFTLLALGYAQSRDRSADLTVGAPATYEVVSIRAGETLWGIASQRYPAADPRLKVAQIEQLNGLSGPTIEAGQTLRVPLR